MRVGTRDSRLAMRQTDIFREKMAAAHPEISIEVVPMKALGDIDLKSPLDQMTSVGAFVRELDEAMLENRIDASVNSLKDIPTKMDPRLTVAAIFERDSPEDVVLPCPLEELPEGARVGTSSIRRRHLIASVRPDLKLVQLRGNIHTRLSKLDAGEYDAIVLAKAGLERMGIDRPMCTLDKRVFVPAPGQGTIAVECRADDTATRGILKALDHRETRQAVTVEGETMRLMGAGCSAPVGINAEVVNGGIRVDAVSFTYTPEPRRFSRVIPADYTLGDLQDIADYLTGKRDSI